MSLVTVITDASPCCMQLERAVGEQPFLQWYTAYTHSPDIQYTYVHLNTYTPVSASFFVSLYRHFADAVTPLPALPPNGPTEYGVLVYLPNKMLRIFPYVGELPYARLPTSCTWGALSMLRQQILCGVTDPQHYKRTYDYTGAHSSTNRARDEVERCLANHQPTRRSTERAPAITHNARRPREGGLRAGSSSKRAREAQGDGPDAMYD